MGPTHCGGLAPFLGSAGALGLRVGRGLDVCFGEEGDPSASDLSSSHRQKGLACSELQGPTR